MPGPRWKVWTNIDGQCGEILLRAGLSPDASDFGAKDVTFAGDTAEQVAWFTRIKCHNYSSLLIKCFDTDRWWTWKLENGEWKIFDGKLKP